MDTTFIPVRNFIANRLRNFVPHIMLHRRPMMRKYFDILNLSRLGVDYQCGRQTDGRRELRQRRVTNALYIGNAPTYFVLFLSISVTLFSMIVFYIVHFSQVASRVFINESFTYLLEPITYTPRRCGLCGVSIGLD